MPKSGHMANQHGKVAAAAILNLLAGQEPNPVPLMTNTCYSFVDARNVIHVASVHRYDPAKRTMLTVPGAGGISAARSETKGRSPSAGRGISGLTPMREHSLEHDEVASSMRIVRVFQRLIG